MSNFVRTGLGEEIKAFFTIVPSSVRASLQESSMVCVSAGLPVFNNQFFEVEVFHGRLL